MTNHFYFYNLCQVLIRLSLAQGCPEIGEAQNANLNWDLSLSPFFSEAKHLTTQQPYPLPLNSCFFVNNCIQ